MSLNLNPRIFIASIWFAIAPISALAQSITAQDAVQHVGEFARVSGTVSQVSHDDRSGVTFVNMGGSYPNQVFTGVIFPDNLSQFEGIDALEGSVVAISGTIKLYKGKAQIILEDGNQISSQ